MSVERCGLDSPGALKLEENPIPARLRKTVGIEISGDTLSAGAFSMLLIAGIIADDAFSVSAWVTLTEPIEVTDNVRPK